MLSPHELVTTFQAALQGPPVTISPQDAPQRAAVAAILQPGRDCPEVLLILRAEMAGDPWSGQIAFPGGRVEKTDSSSRAAAERETFEEIGINLPKSSLYLGRLHDLHAHARLQRLPMAISPFVYWLEAPVSPQVSPEVQEVLWVSLLHLFDSRHRCTVDYARGDTRLELPGIRVGSSVLWGLTLLMLTDFLERISSSPFGDTVRQKLGLGEKTILPPPL